MDEASLDQKDLWILSVLKANARASIREISRETRVRPSTVHQRIKKMTEQGIIEKFTVKLNDEKVGEGFTVFMLVSGSPEQYIDSKILGNEHVKGVYGVTGEYDLLLKLKFRDLKDYNEFLLDFREKYSQYITKTLTMVQTVKIKDE